MQNISLNLARKWRSKTFDQVVGQELSVRMLKNSLYKGHYFPVYLFSGQHGCGKTTVARLFGAAINCEALPLFKEDPLNRSLPCLTCPSCCAMSRSCHPDFTEIDAASHAGVDNVRMLIEASTHLPVLGKKRIYLIDEAHMLSKAAFNAFLKILEDPPVHTLFILATTDAHKIIDPVRSRCFQLLFKPIALGTVAAHLDHVCRSEGIRASMAVLDVIAQVTRGSLRDALNLLEQVRFAGDTITVAMVYDVLGYISYMTVFSLIERVLCMPTPELMQYLNTVCWVQAPFDVVWQQLIECVRALVWASYGIILDEFAHEYSDVLKQLAKNKGSQRAVELLGILCEQEKIISKTPVQKSFIEFCLIQFSLKNNSSDNHNSPLAGQAIASTVLVDNDEEEEAEEELPGESASSNSLVMAAATPPMKVKEISELWGQYMQELQGLKDPLVFSIFSNGTVVSFDNETSLLSVDFSKDFQFFQEWLTESRDVWKPALKRCFGSAVELCAQFTKSPEQKEKTIPDLTISHETKTVSYAVNHLKKNISTYQKKASSYNLAHARWDTPLDVSDANRWKNSELVLKYFPGTTFEWKEETV